MAKLSNDVDRFISHEAQYLAASKGHLGDTLSLATRLLDEYDGLVPLVGPNTQGNQGVAIHAFLWLCRYQLVIGCASILRGHIAAGYSQLRMAIESSAFAARVHKHPGLADVWLDAADDGIEGEAFNRYRDRFLPGKLFARDHKMLGGELWSRYDVCSKFSHPSLFALGNHLAFRDRGDPAQGAFEFHGHLVEVGFRHFQVDGSNGIRIMVQAFLFTIQTHAMLLDVLYECGGKQPKATMQAWKARRKALDEVVVKHLAKWKPQLYGTT